MRFLEISIKSTSYLTGIGIVNQTVTSASNLNVNASYCRFLSTSWNMAPVSDQWHMRQEACSCIHSSNQQTLTDTVPDSLPETKGWEKNQINQTTTTTTKPSLFQVICKNVSPWWLRQTPLEVCSAFSVSTSTQVRVEGRRDGRVAGINRDKRLDKDFCCLHREKSLYWEALLTSHWGDIRGVQREAWGGE